MTEFIKKLLISLCFGYPKLNYSKMFSLSTNTDGLNASRLHDGHVTVRVARTRCAIEPGPTVERLHSPLCPPKRDVNRRQPSVCAVKLLQSASFKSFLNVY